MPTFAGRVEARIVVPTGGAAVSASNSGGGATTVTVPAGNFYLTQAGGVSSLITTLQTQLNTSRAPTSGSWTVSFSTTTGLVSIGCDSSTTARPSFSLDWSSTELRDVLGFTKNINYPLDATELNRQVGYGTWSAAWKFDETSGNAAAAFGTPTLTKSGTVTYSIQGPRGGADKAVSFTTGTSAMFSGGDVLDVTATDDLCFLWVANQSGAPAATRSLVNKYSAGNPRWFLQVQSNLSATFNGDNGTTSGSSSVTLPTGSWYVGMIAMERATGLLRIGYCPIGGSPTVGATGSAPTGTWANAANFAIGQIAGVLDALENMSLAYAAIGVGTGAASGMVANLSTALQNFANAFGTWTGTLQADSVWFPDCPLNIEGDPYQAPRVSDLRTSQSPTGVVLGLTGNSFYRRKGVVWSHVPKDRTWESAVTYANASFQHWFDETQLGLGSSWFTPSSPVQIYGIDGTLVGGAYNSGAGVSGWTITGLSNCEPKPSVAQWTGLFRIEFPELISSG